MKMKKLAVLTVMSSTILGACSKPIDVEPCSTTVANLSGTYKLLALEYKESANSASIDLLATMDPCEKDNVIKLNPDGTYVFTDAGTVCTPSSSETGTWLLSENMIISNGLANGTIQSFNCYKLVVYTENLTVRGDRITQTLIRQ